MITFAELVEWCAGAKQSFGDPSAAVGQVFVRWRADMTKIQGPDMAVGMIDDEVALALGPDFEFLPIEIARKPVIMEEGLVAFGGTEVTPGVWALSPSLNIPGVLHVFVVLYGVPNPAPWERRIIIPGRDV